MGHSTALDLVSAAERPKYAIEFLGEDHEGRPAWHPFAEITIGEPAHHPEYDDLDEAKNALPLRKEGDTTRFRIVNLRSGEPAWISFDPDEPYRP